MWADPKWSPDLQNKTEATSEIQLSPDELLAKEKLQKDNEIQTVKWIEKSQEMTVWNNILSHLQFISEQDFTAELESLIINILKWQTTTELQSYLDNISKEDKYELSS